MTSDSHRDTTQDSDDLFSDGLFSDNCEDVPAIQLTSTGVPFLDKLLCGGTAPGEVYGLMGPYGSCKTTLAIQLLAEAARAFAAEVAAGGEKKVAVLVNFETCKREAKRLLMSYAAYIPRGRMEKLQQQKLSTTEDRYQYERDWERNTHHYGGPIFRTGEWERCEEVRPWLNEHAVMINLQGGQAKLGGIEEVVARVEEILAKRGCRCGFLALDYLGAMGKLKLMEQDGTSSDAQKLARILGQIAVQAKQELAIGFDCPVWLLHQLTGEANEQSPAADLRRSDAAECRSLVEHMDFSFSVGKLRKDHTAKMKCTWHRRKPPRASTIIKVNGGWCRVDEVCDLSVNPRTGKVVAKQDVDVFSRSLPESYRKASS